MKSYHHGNLQQALVENAVSLAREKGPAGVVLREVARRAGVSHNAAYRHFAGRDELIAAVAEVAMSQLEAAMVKKMAPLDGLGPVERTRARLRETGRAYVHFALAEPGLFEVAFSQPFGEDHEAAGGPYTLLGRVLDEMVEAGAMPAEHRPGADVVCWSAVHGFSKLHLDGPLRDLPAEEREQLLDNMLLTVERGLR